MDAGRYAGQLQKTMLFEGVPEQTIRDWLLHANVTVQTYMSGEYLFRTSDTTERLGIILRGSADVTRQSCDGLMHMSTLKRNDLFGAASLFGGDMSYVTDIRCNEPVRALILPEETMLLLLSENRTVLLNYLRYLNSRIRFLNRRLDAFSKNTVPARLMSFLTSEANGRSVSVKSYTKLSESLCISRATLYRALDTLESDGKIRRDRKNIVLLEDYES